MRNKLRDLREMENIACENDVCIYPNNHPIALYEMLRHVIRWGTLTPFRVFVAVR